MAKTWCLRLSRCLHSGLCVCSMPALQGGIPQEPGFSWHVCDCPIVASLTQGHTGTTVSLTCMSHFLLPPRDSFLSFPSAVQKITAPDTAHTPILQGLQVKRASSAHAVAGRVPALGSSCEGLMHFTFSLGCVTWHFSMCCFLVSSFPG